MSSSAKTLTGLTLGVATGLFIGDRAAIFDWAAQGFIKLLQMTVLPYIVLSIVSGLGRLGAAEARTLALRVGAVIAGLWAIALLFTFAIPLAFPVVTSASFFSTSMVEPRVEFDFIGVYVPANPFHALTFGVVPAVVLFSALVGVALIGVERKQQLLDIIHIAAEAVSRTTRLVARLTPYGLFAVAATTAGTLTVEQLARLQVYVITYGAVALLLSLFVFPGLIVTLTPVGRRELFRAAQAPVLTAFAAGDLFIVLPSLIDASKQVIAKHVQGSGSSLPEAIIPAAYNLPHAGKLLSISFVLFAGWFADAQIPVSQYVALAGTGIASFFGSANAAVPFLLDYFRIPADTFQLYLATGVINSRFGALLAAVHTLAVGILGSAAVLGLVRWDRAALFRMAVTTAVASTLIVGGARVLFATVLHPTANDAAILGDMSLMQPVRHVIVHRRPFERPTPVATGLDAMRTRGVLRVGYLPDALPFAFFNAREELVGFDVELAHQLASELGMALEFVPISRDTIAEDLATGRCDVVMSGLAVTTDRASRLLFSSPYLDETLGLLVPDHQRERFSSWVDIATRDDVVIGMPDIPYFADQLQQLLPRAKLRHTSDILEVFTTDPRVDAVAFPAERGSAWTLLHPQYSMVIPDGRHVKVPLAFPVAPDTALLGFINTWLELKRRDGTIERAFQYWILGDNPTPPKRRWAFARDVLHWMD